MDDPRADLMAEGLSPRVRGNLNDGGLALNRRGSIPACAGEPERMAKRLKAMGVYPRVCGGTVPDFLPGGLPGGLSPRVRGNCDTDLCGRRGVGSIPACAGEPPAASSKPRRRPVYPRVCGGTVSPNPLPAIGEGLSPRVRGNRQRRQRRVLDSGSIPACAGEPRNLWANRRMNGVYPRVCGGTSC